MKIGVLTPGRCYGASSVAIMLAEMMSIKMGSPTILTSLDPEDKTHTLYLDLPLVKEITRSLRQVSAMLDARAISGDEVKTYAIRRGEYFSVLNPSVEDLGTMEVANIVEFIAKEMENDVLIVDANLEIGMEEMDKIIDAMDYFVVVLNQSIMAYDKLSKWREHSVSFKEMEEKGIMYVVNNYDHTIDSMRNTVRYFEIPKNKTVFIPYNGQVKLLSNQGRLSELIDYLEDNDIRFASLKYGLEELADKITTDIGLITGGN